MISGAMRGLGGDALARHLLKAENEQVVVIQPRGLGSDDLVWQVRELVGMSLGGRTDRPAYHAHVDPEEGHPDEAASRSRFWALFEREFGLEGQPYCGAEHVKHGRRHEHRVYSLVRPDGSVVDMRWDYLRREKVSRIVEFEAGLAPVPSKHARAIARALVEDGRGDVAAWLKASGSLDAARPVAALTPRERLIQERTGVRLDDVRRAALEAWRASDDGEGLRAALAARGLSLRAGRKGPVVVDAAGQAHLLTRVVGAGARRIEGSRIPAAAVTARLAGLELEGNGNGRVAQDDHGAARRAGPRAGGDPRGARPGADGRGHGVRGSGGSPDGARRDGGRRRGERVAAAIRRLSDLDRAERRDLRRHLRDVARYYAAVERENARAEADRDDIDAVPWGATDMWGVGILRR